MAAKWVLCLGYKENKAFRPRGSSAPEGNVNYLEMTVPHRAEQNKYPMYDYLREWGHNKGSSHINQLHKQPMETAGFTKL